MLRPLRDLLLLRPIQKDVGKVGGLWMPEVGKLSCKASGVCEVVSAGPKTAVVKAKDHVQVEVYDKHFAGDEVTVDGEKLIIIRERDLIGVLT